MAIFDIRLWDGRSNGLLGVNINLRGGNKMNKPPCYYCNRWIDKYCVDACKFQFSIWSWVKWHVLRMRKSWWMR